MFNHIHKWRSGIMILIVSCYSTALIAQKEDDERVLKSDPQRLLDISQEGGKANLLTNLADLESRDVREAPANVTVITSRQMAAAGARTLYEALQLIPGLSFGRDVDDVIGIGIHGNWAEEGKCLFLLNGQQLNENDFGTYSIGDRIPISNVDRIEVIMGPGAVMHGGYAALGVVNIITRTADHGTGTRVNVQSGYSGDNITQTRTSLSGAHRLSRDQEISYTTNHVRGRRSNAMRLLPDSTLLNYGDSTGMQSSMFQFNYRWKNLKASMTYMEENFAMSDASYTVQMRDIIFGLEYKKRLSRKIETFWRVSHTDQLPWYYVNTSEPGRIASNTNNQRTAALGSITFKPTKWLALRIGLTGYHQNSTFYQRNENISFRMNGERSIKMNDGAVFTDMSVSGKPGLFSAGYRYETNNLSGDFLAPRLGYTKFFGNLHLKALWSRSFKIPTLMNLNYGPVDGQITTEHVTTKEAEIGYRIGKAASLTANVYETKIDNPIVYVYDGITLDNYVNRNAAGTYGGDLRLSWETKRFTLLAGYGINRPIDRFDLIESQLPDSLSTHVQGLPTQRALLVVAYDISPSWTVRARSDYRGTVWSYQRMHQASDELGLVAWPKEITFNAGFTWRPKASTRLAIDVGCRNITDVQRTVVSPFNNGTTPLALNGREYTLGLTYKFVQ